MADKKTRKFKTEVQQLLDLVIHSLYTNKDIFLRELVSNASDAIDQARFRSLSDKSIMEEDTDWKIKLIPDKENGTLTVSDNGIGMHPDEIDSNIGTIASSGTQRFLEEMKKNEGNVTPEMIGEFGVGFYSAFMIADKVEVVTRAPDAEPIKWGSSGSGSYSVESADKEERGTDVIVHLSEGYEEYLEEWKIRKIVKTYSDFIEYPIVMDVEKPKEGEEEKSPEEQEKELVEETLNSQKAIWAKPPEDISEDEYNEFYKHISHDFMDPLKTIHWSVEGTTEFRALLYVPQKAPFDLYVPESRNKGVNLYVKNVFITDNCESLIPSWLRFLRGVVDSADLPLNVSRETLQDNRVLQVIQKNIVKKVLDTFEEMRDNERENFVQFWNEFGKVFKEGVHMDPANQEKLADLLLYESTKTEEGNYTTLKEYVDRMSEDQKEIYYITGESTQVVANSPLLEAFRARDYEVLFLTDPIDEWVVQSLNEYSGTPLKSVAKGDIDFGDKEEEEGKEDEEESEESKSEKEKENEELLAFLKDTLGEDVKDVKISSRLTESPCCLVAGEQDMGMHMEKLLKEMQQEVPATKRILELNPEHGLIQKMNELVKDNSNHMRLKEYAETLCEQAKLTAGLELKNPVEFSQRVSRMMAEEADRVAE